MASAVANRTVTLQHLEGKRQDRTVLVLVERSQLSFIGLKSRSQLLRDFRADLR